MSNLGQHDGDGIRYAMHLSAPKGGSAQMLRDPAGGWVSWEDYARLKAEVRKLTTERDANLVDAGSLFQENARLKAEVERLTADLNKMTKTPEGVDYVEVDVGFWTKSGSRLPSSYSTFWSNDKGVQS